MRVEKEGREFFGAEIRDANLDQSVTRRFVLRLLGPHSVDASVQSGNSVVIAHEDSLRVKRLVHPGKVLIGTPTVTGSGQSDRLLPVLRVASTVVEDDVHRTISRINSHPLKKLIRAVVRGVIVDANGWTPRFAVIRGPRAEYVHIAIAVIAPRHVQPGALRAATRVDGNLCKSIGPRHGLQRKHRGGRVNNISRMRKGHTAIVRSGENDVTAVRPHRVQSAIWPDGTGKSLNGSVIVARKSANVVDLHRLGPSPSVIRGANK